MAHLFKDRFQYDTLHKLALEIQEVYDTFSVEDFLKSTMDETWDLLEFKQRIMKIGLNLGNYLPADYKEAIHILDQVILNYEVCFDGFVSFFPAFIELYGQDQENWDISMEALARYTPYASAEFAVRSFIIKDEKRMMAQMYTWSKSENEHIRRLASEGCRPRLPWGQALPSIQKDPSLSLPILENLKEDPSPYVRKSVANHLNDISKTHPELVINLSRKWYGKNTYTDWIVKQGCRTLLKKGNKEVMELFGFMDVSYIKVDNFFLNPTRISIGENITFSFEIEAPKETMVRLEYGIDYVKARNKKSRKIFQISELVFKNTRKKVYTKTHSFADTSTRKHYPGPHLITLIVNGVEKGSLYFEVLNNEKIVK